MNVGKAYPKSIKDHPFSMVWKGAWKKMHKENQMFSAVFCAKPGMGKSWSAMSVADMLDRDTDDKPRFDFKRIAFGAEDFSKMVRTNWKKGTVIMLDDAGLALYSREAMTQTVRDVSKIFQSVRYKNLCILLTLPSFAMLDVNVRRLIDCYIEVLHIDQKEQQTVCKFHWLQSNPHSGVIYRHRQPVTKKELLGNGISINRSYVLDNIRIDRPRQELVVPYEKEKARCMDANYKKFYDRIIEKEEKNKKGVSLLDDYNDVMKNVELYTKQNGRLSVAKLQLSGRSSSRAIKLVELYRDEESSIEELVKRQGKRFKSRYHKVD